MRRFLFSCTLAAVLFAAAPANAQSLGTFRWRLADFCSVVNVNVIQQGSFYQLIGYEEQCGGNPRLPVYGSAMLQADGTIWLGFTTIFPFGNGLHTQVTLNSSLSGFWRDNANQSGAFTLNPGPGPFTGRPPTRMSPSVWGMNPAITLRSVVLPHPDGPTMDTNSPAGTSSDKSRTAVTFEPAWTSK